MSRLLLSTDLDRTLSPNGPESVSVPARKRFHDPDRHPQAMLVYVTGLHQQPVQQAREDYQLPQPDYIISEVDSTIYEVHGNNWQYQEAWERRINRDWRNKSAIELHCLFGDI